MSSPDEQTPHGEDVTELVMKSEGSTVHIWVERELREARQALWDGRSGKAFSAIEAAQEEFETVEEALREESNAGGSDE